MLNAAAKRTISIAELMLCSSLLAFVAWHGVGYNRFMKSVVHHPHVLCSSSNPRFAILDMQGTKGCVRRAEADEYESDKASIQIGLVAFLVILFVPALAMRQISFRGWNREG